MQVSYGQVKEHSAAVAAAIADARSARNLASRRRAENAREEREADYHRRRRKRKSEHELEELLRRVVRVKVPKEERPRVGASTARNLYHRTVDMLIGTTGLSDARGPDGLYSIHFGFTARGFASTKGRRWRRGEAERAARYIVREDGLEGGERGWWSSIAADRNELVAFYRASEALEQHDRSNANVYISEIITLPHELSARQRRKAVRRICRFFDKRGLPYTVAIHLPDEAGDQRNYHVHIIYSLRPCTRHGPYDWSFGVAKEADLNTTDGIKARRVAVVQAINTTLRAAGSAKRYTHLSNKARGMAAGQVKLGQGATWVSRRLKALEDRVARLRQLSEMVTRLREVLGQTGYRLQRQKAVAAERLRELHHQVEAVAGNSRSTELKAVVRERLAAHAQAISRTSADTLLAAGAAQAGTRARLDNMGATLEASQTKRSRRLADLAANAKVREEHVRLFEREAAIRQALTAYGDSMTEARNDVASWLSTMGAGNARQIAERIARLAHLGRIAERVGSANRLGGLAAAVNRTISSATTRLFAAERAVRARLQSMQHGPLRLEEQAKRLTSLGGVAEHRPFEGQRTAPVEPADGTITSAIQGTRAVRQQQVPAIDERTDNEHRPHDSGIAGTARRNSRDDQRGSERRKAIAAAAWQLRGSSFPPQVRTETGFAISSRFAGSYRDVDRFEAEDVIREIHTAKRAQMLAAVQRKVEGAERSPFIERDGWIRLPPQFFDQPLRRAVELAAKDADLVQAVDQSLLFWREREAAARKARARKAREAADRSDRMRPGVQKVFDAIKNRMRDGRYPQPVIAAIRNDVLVVAEAVGAGRLAMRISQTDRQFYFASEELRTTVAKLAALPVGREVIAALGRLTLEEPFEPAELSIGWLLPRPVFPHSSAQGETIGVDPADTWKKGGAER